MRDEEPVDVLIVGVISPRPVRFLSWEGFERQRIMRFLTRTMGTIPVAESKAKDAITYLALIKEELGNRWLQPDLFRFGASSLLNDIERQLEHYVTGNYSAGYRHATS